MSHLKALLYAPVRRESAAAAPDRATSITTARSCVEVGAHLVILVAIGSTGAVVTGSHEMVKKLQKLQFKQVEEHVSPGGKTKYTTKPGAEDGAKRQDLGRARKKQGHAAPREAAKSSRRAWTKDETTVSPGGNTVYSRPMTPSPLKKGNPSKMDQALHARERQLLQQRQSARLLDARARKQAAAAGIDGRLLLGLNLLRDALAGNLAGLSDVQIRGTLVNALVALRTPDESETYGEVFGPEDAEGWYDFNLLRLSPHLVEEFYRERSRNARLLVQAGACQLVAETLKMYPDDLEIAYIAFKFLCFLLTECDDCVEAPSHQMTYDAARMMIHHGTLSLALNAVLRPFGEWKWPDFKSAGNVFSAVVNRHMTYADAEIELTEHENNWGGPYHVIPNQPCRMHYCHDTEFDRGAKGQGFRYPSDRNPRAFYGCVLFHVSAFVMAIFFRLEVVKLCQIPDDFAIRWSRRLDELFEELLSENLTGYPIVPNQTMNTLTHCFTITENLAEEPRWLSLLRQAGCFDVISRVAVTEIPFPAVLRLDLRKDTGFRADMDAARASGRDHDIVYEWSNALECWRYMKQLAEQIRQRLDTGSG